MYKRTSVVTYPQVKFAAARHSIRFLLSISSNHLRYTISTYPRACNSFSPSCKTSWRARLLFAPALLREDKTWLATENVTLGINLKESVNGVAVNKSFFVNAPANTSKRCEPEFVIMIFGIEARVLLIASAKGIAYNAQVSNQFLLSNFLAIQTHFLDEQGRERIIWRIWCPFQRQLVSSLPN